MLLRKVGRPMTKSELIAYLAEQNPHLYQRDVERLLRRSLMKLHRLCVEVIGLNSGVLVHFQLNNEVRG